MGDNKPPPDFRNTYDLSKDQREVIDWRAQRRAELRHQFLRLTGDPNNRNHVFDAAIQRQYTAVFAYEHLFKPRMKNFIWSIFLVGVPWAILYTTIQGEKDERESRFRTGQVSYKDRDWKFV